MHLRDQVNLIDFLINVKKCQGEVFFETPEGDCLALRSALSQYIFCALTNQPSLLKSGTVRCEKEEDLALLADYLL